MTNTEVYKALRLSRKLSHRDIAAGAGIHQSQSRNIEAGKSVPSVVTAIKIARLLRAKVETLWPVA